MPKFYVTFGPKRLVIDKPTMVDALQCAVDRYGRDTAAVIGISEGGFLNLAYKVFNTNDPILKVNHEG